MTDVIFEYLVAHPHLSFLMYKYPTLDLWAAAIIETDEYGTGAAIYTDGGKTPEQAIERLSKFLRKIADK